MIGGSIATPNRPKDVKTPSYCLSGRGITNTLCFVLMVSPSWSRIVVPNFIQYYNQSHSGFGWENCTDTSRSDLNMTLKVIHFVVLTQISDLLAFESLSQLLHSPRIIATWQELHPRAGLYFFFSCSHSLHSRTGFIVMVFCLFLAVSS